MKYWVANAMILGLVLGLISGHFATYTRSDSCLDFERVKILRACLAVEHRSAPECLALAKVPKLLEEERKRKLDDERNAYNKAGGADFYY